MSGSTNSASSSLRSRATTPGHEVPRALKVWFVIHFVLDVVSAVPLMLAPQWTLGLLGWQRVDPVATRLVAAALFGIGIESLLGREGSWESFRGMLNLKVIWSAAACLGLIACLAQDVQGRPWALWGALAIFAGFNLVWVYWRIRAGRDGH